jgi:hypothetical protein
MASSARDLRVDLLRGAALLFILWDHILEIPHTAQTFFLHVTPKFWGLSTALAIFVFLSGYVYGIVYRKIVRRRGVKGALLKSYSRAWSLHVVNLFTLLATLGLLGGGHLLLGTSALADAPYNLGSLADLSAQEAWHLLTLRFFPGPFAVLPLYVALLLIVPLFLGLLRWHPAAALAGSGAMYLAAQGGLHLSAPLMACCNGLWPFNPFAWQFLFVIAMVLGWARPRLLRPFWGRAALVVVAGVALKVWLAGRLARHGMPVPEWGTAPLPWSEKATLGPIRLAYFLVLAYAAGYLTQPLAAWLRRPTVWTRLLHATLVRPGQHSLGVYAGGVVVMVVANVLLVGTTPHWSLTVGAIGAGWAVSMALAYGMAARASLKTPAPRPAAASSAQQPAGSPKAPAPPAQHAPALERRA